MRVICINCPGLAQSLRAYGNEVNTLTLGSGVFSLPGLLERSGFPPPDLLVHSETLGKRVLLKDAGRLDCLTVFIAVDAHLNLYWQRHYARQFDILATPHLSLFKNLPPGLRHPGLKHFPHSGQARPFKSHQNRANLLGLCARVNSDRPLRAALVEFLWRETGLVLHDALPFGEMMAFYDDCRLIPNELIAAEVNFRLFEGASCGALVFSPDIGEDQNLCFEPGREFIPYSHGLELLDQIKFYGARPGLAETKARAAWKRVNGEHLPAHRAKAMLSWAPAARLRASGPASAAQFWLALVNVARSGLYADNPGPLLPEGVRLAANPALDEDAAADVAAACLVIMAESLNPASFFYTRDLEDKNRENLLADCRASIAENRYAFSLAYNFAASAAALRLQDLTLARLFWLRHCRASGVANPVTPQTPARLWLHWAKELRQCGLTHQAGFPFKPGLHIPACAMECLLEAKQQPRSEESATLDAALLELYAGLPAFAFQYYELARQLHLAEPENWRREAEYAMASARAFQMEHAAKALRSSGLNAEKAGKYGLFRRMLALNPALEYIQKIEQ